MTFGSDRLSVGSKITGAKAMSGRMFVWLLATLLLTTVCPAEAQHSTKIPRVAYLSAGSASSQASRVEVFKQGLRELGYVEGKNIVIEYRYTETKTDLLSTLAAELVREKIEVILTVGTNPTQAARRATATIPVVMTFVADPIGSGFVASLARPGGNITGLTNLAPELSGKWLELLKEMVPKPLRAGVLIDPSTPVQKVLLQEMERAAKALAVEVQPAEVRDPNAIESALATLRKGRPNALIVLPPPRTMDTQKSIVEFAAMQRLPTMSHWREYVDAGGLAFYGASIHDMYRRAAVYVDKILKGARPADLPVEQPTKFELIINLKAAKQIGLTIPPNVLARADKVIK
jgi:putative tryptophan/tyrosine transport system substrate-binding protein